jgi:hypothetical protein
MLCLPYYVCVLSSTKLEISAEQVLHESEGWRGGGQKGEEGGKGEK